MYEILDALFSKLVKFTMFSEDRHTLCSIGFQELRFCFNVDTHQVTILSGLWSHALWDKRATRKTKSSDFIPVPQYVKTFPFGHEEKINIHFNASPYNSSAHTHFSIYPNPNMLSWTNTDAATTSTISARLVSKNLDFSYTYMYSLKVLIRTSVWLSFPAISPSTKFLLPCQQASSPNYCHCRGPSYALWFSN